jgi:hypothetical protein
MTNPPISREQKISVESVEVVSPVPLGYEIHITGFHVDSKGEAPVERTLYMSRELMIKLFKQFLDHNEDQILRLSQ